MSTSKTFLAELFGTMFILLFGNGVSAMNSLFNLGGYTNVSIGWGLGVFLGILVSSRISGAHLNPAITISFMVARKFPISKGILYIIAQMIGAFIGAAIVYYFYYTKFLVVDPSLSNTAGIFTTFRATGGMFTGIFSEFVASALLIFGVLAIVDHFGSADMSLVASFAIGALIVALGMSFGGMHGYAMNPARDFSPRLFVWLAGFKNTGFDNTFVWLDNIIGSITGGIFAAILYNITLRTDNTPSTVATPNNQ